MKDVPADLKKLDARLDDNIKDCSAIDTAMMESSQHPTLSNQIVAFASLLTNGRLSNQTKATDLTLCPFNKDFCFRSSLNITQH